MKNVVVYWLLGFLQDAAMIKFSRVPDAVGVPWVVSNHIYAQQLQTSSWTWN